MRHVAVGRLNPASIETIEFVRAGWFRNAHWKITLISGRVLRVESNEDRDRDVEHLVARFKE